MGSDLYMEARNFSPRPSKVTWTGPDTIKVEKDVFYDGWTVVYEGKVTPEIKKFLKGMGITIPKPGKIPGVFDAGDQVTVPSLKGIISSANRNSPNSSKSGIVKVEVEVDGIWYLIDFPRGLVSHIKDS